MFVPSLLNTCPHYSHFLPLNLPVCSWVYPTISQDKTMGVGNTMVVLAHFVGSVYPCLCGRCPLVVGQPAPPSPYASAGASAASAAFSASAACAAASASAFAAAAAAFFSATRSAILALTSFSAAKRASAAEALEAASF